MHLSGTLKTAIAVFAVILVITVSVYLTRNSPSEDHNSDTTDKPLSEAANAATVHQHEIPKIRQNVANNNDHQASLRSSDQTNQNLLQTEDTAAVPNASDESVANATMPESGTDTVLMDLSDVMENILLPAFSQSTQSGTSTMITLDQQTALEIFVSRLPQDMDDEDFEEIETLLKDHLPYDTADLLLQSTKQIYQENARQQAHLAGIEAPKTMQEQIEIARQLQHSVDDKAAAQSINDSEPDKPSEALSEWQQTERRLKEIQSSSSDPESDIHTALTEAYGAELADDVSELSDIEKQWQQRYASFLAEKQIISESGLSADDKAEQIESLIQQHYKEEERDAARGYDRMMMQQQAEATR